MYFAIGIAGVIAFAVGMRFVFRRDEEHQEFLDEQHGRGQHTRDTSWPAGPGPNGPTG